MAVMALNGGLPTWQAGWPNWPQSSEATRRNLDAVLASHRWSISGQYRGEPSWEQRFGTAFAGFTGAAHCIPAATGTASLTMALEACGVGAGDEVIVPGVTWVASASAVLGVNAVPILVDVDPRTGCLDPDAVDRAITPRCRAITVVHLGSAVADLDGLLAVAQRHNVPLIEDCAQAHGAHYHGRHVGRFGVAGTFSMQHSKLLTSGEGGAVITDDEVLARRLAHLRADGRTIATVAPPLDEMELIETAEVMGSNYCLSEFHAAILIAQLEKLPAELERRAANAARLVRLLRDVGCSTQETAQGTTARAYYTYVVRLPDEVADAVASDRAAAALTAELGLPIKAMYAPLDRNRLYRPDSRRRFALSDAFAAAVQPERFSLPSALAFTRSCVAMPHRMLLADPDGMEVVAAAFAKLVANYAEIA